MRGIVKLGLAAAMCGLCFSAGHLMAQEGGAGGMPPWMNLTKEHKELQKSVGEWDVEMKWWMAPGMEPSTEKGTAVSKSILGGKYVQQEFTGSVMGMPFSGLGFSGYDTVEKKYADVWMDNMSPVMLVHKGTPKDGAIEFKGKGVNQMTGKKQDERREIKWEGNDKFLMNFYQPGPDGKERLFMVLTYNRKKKAAETPK